MLKAAQQARDNFMMVTCVAREAVGLSQAFLTNATGGGVHPAGAFLSQAKTTLNCYSGGGGCSTDGLTTSASVVNISLLIMAAAAHTHGPNFVTASTLSSV
jgi:hypothetical protein